MDEQASKENPSKDFNKLDLSQLQGFSFGTQWTQDKSPPSHQGDSRRADERGERPRRSGGSGGDRRDRRSFRKPAGDTGAPSSDTGAPQQRDERGERPRRDFREGGQGGGARRDFRGSPRRDDRRGDDRRGGGQGEFRGGQRREGGQQPREHFQGPYFSPYYDVVFYPEDTGFAALVKAIRTSCRTYELFEIARVVIGKNDRFVATIQRKRPGAQNKNPRAQQQSQTAPAAGAAPESAQEKPAAPAKLPPLAISIPDGIPFDNEEAAIAHVLNKHLDKFFDTAEVEVDPPKGNYQVINKCGITGELLGPPNYHLYNQIVQQHHSARLGRMGLEAFRSRIETVRDPEVVNQWLEKMKKAVRYTWKLTPPAEGAQPMSFDSFDDARAYLLSTAREKVVRTVETARMHGKLLENMPQGEMRRAIESTLERQRRFPLDTANALRGRLRREGFTIFKRGSKGISYVCAVKRKFRVPGQTFADSIDALIAYIEANPMVKASELPAKFLGIHQDEPAPAVEVTPVPAVEATPAGATEAVVAPETAPVEAAPAGAAPEPAPEAGTESGASAPADAASPVPAESVPTAEPAPVAETAPEAPASETAPVESAPESEPAAAPESAPEADATPAPAAEQTAPPIAPATSGSVAPFEETSTPLSAEDHARLHRLTGDLRWLVSEGYVTEYIDGSLFTYPPMSEARKKEVESEDGDTSAPVPEAHSEPQPEAQPAAQAEPEPARPVAETEQPVEQPPAAPEDVAAPPEPAAAAEPEPAAPMPAGEPVAEQSPGTENEPKL